MLKGGGNMHTAGHPEHFLKKKKKNSILISCNGNKYRI